VHGRLARILLVVIAAAVVAGGVWLLGRPATLNHGQVTREQASIASTIAESQLLAKLVGDGKGYSRATKSHAAELTKALDTSAELLSTATLPKRDAQSGATAAKLAGDASDELQVLVAHPGDKQRAKDAEGALKDLSDKAAKL
jgi:hypothetical protein